jgi:hypothetical protein
LKTSLIVILAIIVSVFPEKAGASFHDIKGMNYTAWKEFVLNSEKSDMSLSKVKNIGCDWVSICVWWFQDGINSSVIGPDRAQYSVNPDSVAHAIDSCHKLGMKVMLKPIVNCRDAAWNGFINPSDEWFASYHHFINLWANLAKICEVDLFCVGAELSKTESWSKSWRDVISDVRTHYNGLLFMLQITITRWIFFGGMLLITSVSMHIILLPK